MTHNNAVKIREWIRYAKGAWGKNPVPFFCRKLTLRLLRRLAWTGTKKASALTSKEWHNVMIGNNSVHALVEKIRGNVFPVWCRPLLEHSSPGDSILELGSGTGELSAILGIYGRTPHLLDYSKDSLDYAKSVFESLGINGNFYFQDLLKGISLETGSIDWVWSSGLLEHFSDEVIVNMLKESRRVARKGVMSLVPNANAIFYRTGKFKMEQEGTWPYGIENPKYTMRGYFEAAGLKNIGECSVGPYHSLEFFHSGNKEVKEFYDSLDKEELKKLNQGYLLFTYGEK